ncbi:Rha family transcriptional regulator [Lysinibacillus sp. NPDC097195]|uniref:Rha family transcriptional regulator n=1 Tax=Lysinibacillus sp. NPDC097195 TaxID=3364141 RepID=UPI00380BCA03
MNQLNVVSFNGQLVTDSRQVAKMVGKRHADLLESISSYKQTLDNGKFRSQEFFINHTYKSLQNKGLPCFLLTRKGCDMVANKMTGEKGVLFTAAYVTRFEEMEEQLKATNPKLPSNYKEALMALIEKEEEREQLELENRMYKQQIADAKPKLTYIDEVLRCTDLLLTTQIAEDYGMSAIAFNKLLHKHGIQYNLNKQWLLYSKYKGLGYTKSETKEFRKPDGSIGVNLHTKWTQKGRLFLYETLKTKGILPTMEQMKLTLIENKSTEGLGA